MSFSSPHPSGAGPTRTVSRQLARLLVGSVLAGTGLALTGAAKPSRPYLAMASPPPLRFAPPPPDLSIEPAPAAPPHPDGVLGEVAQANQEAIAPAEPEAEPSITNGEPAGDPAALAPVSDPASAQPPETSRPPVELLPDDLAPRYVPADFLPYFLPPQIQSAPPSSATYQQR